jgi:hypothetical protein
MQLVERDYPVSNGETLLISAQVFHHWGAKPNETFNRTRKNGARVSLLLGHKNNKINKKNEAVYTR